MQNKAKQPQSPGLTIPTLVLHWRVLEEVIKTIGNLPAESGGAIGGNGDGTHASIYHFDESSRNSAVTYSPDYKQLNRLFKSEWNPKGIRLRGFIHSHPGRMSCLSYGDEVYAENILKAIDDLDCLWLPIVNTVPDTGQFKLTPWAVYLLEKGVAVVRGQIQVVHAPALSILEAGGERVLSAIRFDVPLHDIAIGTPRRVLPVRTAVACSPAEEQPGCNTQEVEKRTEGEKVATASCEPSERKIDVNTTFERVQSAYDLDLMLNSRIIAVGAGGAASWLEDLARAGLGQFVAIDPDVVSETNLATQQTYRRDIGRAKVDCIAERIRDINPTATFIAIPKSLDDLTDDEIRCLSLNPLDGRATRRTVICGLTDNFFAQARVNRLALQLGVPSLCAQVYREGRGAEVTFTFPGVTPACHRCILSSRYRYFLEQGQGNDVTSHGTPIFSTTRLNAIKGFVTLALLHHGSSHPRWGNMLSRIGNRNLIQIRMDPDFAETMKMTVFNRVFEKADQDRLFFDEVVWLPQKQESPETGYSYHCPDCGGTGDLRNAIGTLQDTKLAQPVGKVQASEHLIANVHAKRAIEAYRQNGRLT